MEQQGYRLFRKNETKYQGEKGYRSNEKRSFDGVGLNDRKKKSFKNSLFHKKDENCYFFKKFLRKIFCSEQKKQCSYRNQFSKTIA